MGGWAARRLSGFRGRGRAVSSAGGCDDVHSNASDCSATSTGSDGTAKWCPWAATPHAHLQLASMTFVLIRVCHINLAKPCAQPDTPECDLGSGYRFGRLLNRGGQGAVVQAIHIPTGEAVAIKLLPRHANLDVTNVTSSLVNHAALSAHPHIIGFREAFLTPCHLAVVMDLADGGDLAERLSRHVQCMGEGMAEPAARRIFQQLVSALEWIHRSGVAVGDVKCDNVLLAGRGSEVRLADFGWSCANAIGGRCSDRLCGTPEYIAPEILLRTAGTDARAADCWAAGVTLWTLIGGGFPFLHPEEECLDRAGRMGVMALRIACGSPRQLPCRGTPAFANLLERLLDPNPATRITTAEVAAHPWVVKDLPPGLATLNDRLAAAAAAAGSGGAACCRQQQQVSPASPGAGCRPPTKRSGRGNTEAVCSAGGSGPPWGGVRQGPAQLTALVVQAAAVAEPFPPDPFSPGAASLLDNIYSSDFGRQPQQGMGPHCYRAGGQATACC